MSKFINYIPLLILLTFYSCQTNINKEYTEIGGLSILEFPESQELQKWIESDSQYKQVFQVRRYFEDLCYARERSTFSYPYLRTN